MSFKKHLIKVLAVLSSSLILFALPACQNNNQNTNPDNNNNGNNNNNSVTDSPLNLGDMFTERDLSGGYSSGYKASDAISIKLANGSSSCSNNAVKISGNTVNITKEGVYKLSGSLTEGQIVVEVAKTEKVQLILSGVTITNKNTCAIYVKSCDKTFITLEKGSQNKLSVSGNFSSDGSENIDGAIYAKDDITIGGEGSIEVVSSLGHAVVCNDDLKITGGEISVDAEKCGFNGKDSVRIGGGNLTVNAGSDGFRSDNEEADKGFIFFGAGSAEVECASDGLDAFSSLQINGGNIKVTASGKALKGGDTVAVNGGTLNLSATDDTVHSTGTVSISGGDITCSTGDDAVHADQKLIIGGGSVNVVKSHEGLESSAIEINGGTIDIVADDDGINAGGGVDNSGFGGLDGGGWQRPSSTNNSITITDGIINVNSSGDGLDANGNITVSGGEIYVSSSTSNMDAAIDFDGTGIITGGIVVATGSSGMAQNFGASSTQGSILSAVSSASGEIRLEDASGNEIVSFTPAKKYTSVVISSPDLSVGESYTLICGGNSTQINMTSLLYGSSHGGS